MSEVYRNATRMMLGNQPKPWPTQIYHQKSITLNGSDERASFGNVLNYERTQPMSIAAWVKTSTLKWQSILTKCGSASPYKGWAFMMVNTGLGGRIRFEERVTPGTNHLAVATSMSFVTGAWRHIVATYSGSSTGAGVKLYVNGVLDTSTIDENTLSSSITTAFPVCLGATNNAIDHWNGQLAEVAVWNSALTYGQASAVYRARDLRQLSFASALQAYWSGDGSSGSLIPDYSGYGRNGTPDNMDASNFTADVHTPT